MRRKQNSVLKPCPPTPFPIIQWSFFRRDSDQTEVGRLSLQKPISTALSKQGSARGSRYGAVHMQTGGLFPGKVHATRAVQIHFILGVLGSGLHPRGSQRLIAAQAGGGGRVSAVRV